MSVRQVAAGSTDVSVVIRIIDSTDGTPETGVVFDTSGIDLWYRREGAASTDITEADLSTPALTDAHSDGGFLHINDGWYRLDLPDAACASGVAGVQIGGTVTGMVVLAPYIELTTDTAALSDIESSLVIVKSDTLAIEAKASDTHSRLVVVESAIDSDQTSRTSAISDVKSELAVVSGAVATVDAAIDSDQTSRATAISDIKSELVIVSDAVSALDAAVDSDQTSRASAISDVKSRLVVVESAIDSDQTSRTAAISDVKSELTKVYSDTTVVESDTTVVEAGVNVTSISDDSGAADRLEALMDGLEYGQVNDASATTTAFAADGFTEATDDHYNGRLITFVTGNLKGQQTDITDYDAADGPQGAQEFTVTALTEAPANDDFFVIH